MQSARLTLCLLVLVGCSSGPAASDGAVGDADAGTDAPVVDLGADLGPVCTTEWDAGDQRPDLGTFVPAMHAPLANVINPGGHVCAHPQVVTISYAGDPHAAGFEEFADFVVSSSWLTAVGTEYGVGTGAVAAKLRIPGSGPTTITDDQLKHVIVSQITTGALPEPDGDPNDSIYMFYFPATTTVLGMDGNPICPMGPPGSFVAGYHYEYADDVRHFAYAVIDGCDPSQSVNDYEFTASHELIEAATDPYPTLDPAYTITDPTNVWSYTFGELGDLCNEKVITSCGHRLTRVWSNAAAMAGGPPCAPVPAGEAYFNTSIPTTMAQSVTPGQVLTFPLTGFSDRPVPDWFTYVTGYPALSTFNVDIQPGAPFSMNNGTTLTLTLTVPTTAPRGGYATVYVISTESPATATIDDNTWPIALYVP